VPSSLLLSGAASSGSGSTSTTSAAASSGGRTGAAAATAPSSAGTGSRTRSAVVREKERLNDRSSAAARFSASRNGGGSKDQKDSARGSDPPAASSYEVDDCADRPTPVDDEGEGSISSVPSNGDEGDYCCDLEDGNADPTERTLMSSSNLEDPTVLTAELVDEESMLRQMRSQAEKEAQEALLLKSVEAKVVQVGGDDDKAQEEKEWYKKNWFIGGAVLVLVIIIVAVVAGVVSFNNKNNSNNSQAEPIVSCDPPVECVDRPDFIRMLLAGGLCNASQNEQLGGGFFCQDYDGAPLIRPKEEVFVLSVLATNKSRVYFQGNVRQGDTFTLFDLSERKKWKADAVNVTISTIDFGPVQHVMMQSSCVLAPLKLGDTFGTSEVVEYRNPGQGTVGCAGIDGIPHQDGIKL